MALALKKLGSIGDSRIIFGKLSAHGIRPNRQPTTSIQTLHVRSKPIFQRLASRQYAIRDRYYFPLSEQEKMAIKLEEEQAEKSRISEEHRAAKRALRREKKYATPRATITLPGPDVIYGEEDPVIQPAAPKALNVAVIGPANAGKSTWTNRMCGARVTPVSSKPQTTRERMCGVATIENTQLVIYDTPGLLSDMDRKAIGRSITKSTWNTLDEVDLALVFLDSVKTIDQTTRDLIHRLHSYQKERAQDNSIEPLKAILFLNKYDKYETGKFRVDTKYPVKDRFRLHFSELDDIFSQVLCGSALTGDGIADLTDALLAHAVEREWDFARETKTPLSPLDIVFEIVREKLFRHLNQELPYLVVQENVGWTEDPLRAIIRIDQKLYVRKDSQRSILHGHIKSIIYEAERDLATALGTRVILNLNVIVRKEAVEPALSDAMVDFDL